MTKVSASARNPVAKNILRAVRYVRRKISQRLYTLIYVHQDAAVIERSGLFDREWYLKQYPDVAETKMDPIKHYLRYGAAEGRDPNADFSTWGYLDTYPDVSAHGANPFIHYVQYGQAEGRALLRKDYAAWIDDYDRLSDDDRRVF